MTEESVIITTEEQRQETDAFIASKHEKLKQIQEIAHSDLASDPQEFISFFLRGMPRGRAICILKDVLSDVDEYSMVGSFPEYYDREKRIYDHMMASQSKV